MVPTAVLSMTGKIKHSEDQAVLSSPEEEVLTGTFPVLLGHPEAWGSDLGHSLTYIAVPPQITFADPP